MAMKISVKIVWGYLERWLCFAFLLGISLFLFPVAWDSYHNVVLWDLLRSALGR
jgi:hypothetical protein